MNPTPKNAAADMSPVCSYLIFPLFTSGLLETSIPVDICLQNLYLWVFLLPLSRGWRYGEHGPNLCKVMQLCPKVPGIHLYWLCTGGRRKDSATLQPSRGER